MNADLKQVEWRVGAFLSQDPVMIQELIDGVDIHTSNAISIFGSDEFRQAAKTISFRSLFGGSASGFYNDSNMPNFSLKKWKEIVDAFCNKYSGLTNWWNAMILQVERGHDIITPSKRRLSFGMYYNESSGVYEYSKPQIKNYPVQSFSSDCMYVCMHNIYSQLVKYKFKSKIICQVHDSIVYDFVKNEESNLIEINLNIMNNLDKYISDYYGINYNVPMGGDIEIGSNYGDLKPIN